MNFAKQLRLQSGLQYRILREGTGKRTERSDWVKMHFRGSLTDGSEYDASYRNGKPSILPVAKLIAGWSGDVQEAVGYTGFFVYAAATGIPSIILAIIVVRKSAGRRQ